MNNGSTPSFWPGWGVACVISALVSALVLRWLPEVSRIEAQVGWALTCALAATGPFLLPRALGPDSTRFLVFGLGNQLLRFGLLLACFVALTWTEKSSALGFVSSGLVSYLVHLFAEITWLARGPVGDSATR
jgi:hypothetical protein